MNHRKLVALTESYESTLEWMFQEQFINNIVYCNTCNQIMVLEQNHDTKRWRCKKCRKTLSIFQDTILFNCHKPLIELIDLFYFWALDLKQNQTGHEANTASAGTIHRWYKKLSSQAYHIMINHRPAKIGGVGHIVEVDESKFSKRKYNVGRTVRSPWVVGGVDINTGDLFFVEVFRRDKETLSALLLENIEIGTMIYTDCWAGYIDLSLLGFQHYTVNHSTNFIDPTTSANTQAIENRWSVYKKKFRSRSISYNGDLSLYFAEFMFKLKFKTEAFMMLMRNLNKFD